MVTHKGQHIHFLHHWENYNRKHPSFWSDGLESEDPVLSPIMIPWLCSVWERPQRLMYSGVMMTLKEHWEMSIIFGVIPLQSLDYLLERTSKENRESCSLTWESYSKKAGVVSEKNFLLPKTNVSASGLMVTGSFSVHINITESSTSDLFKGWRGRHWSVGRLPGDASISAHSHGSHCLTALMTLQ